MDTERRLRVFIAGEDDVDRSELDMLTVQLRLALLDAGVMDVTLGECSVPAPRGSKPVFDIQLGMLIVTAAPLVFPSIVSLVRTWMKNRPVRTVTFECGDRRIELSGTSAKDQRRLIEAFLANEGGEPSVPSNGES